MAVSEPSRREISRREEFAYDKYLLLMKSMETSSSAWMRGQASGEETINSFKRPSEIP
jgi:hypothetical protein